MDVQAIDQSYQQLQTQRQLQAIHSFVGSSAQPQSAHQQAAPQPPYEQPQYPQAQYPQGQCPQSAGAGGMVQRFLGGGFGQAIMAGAGFGIGIGDDLINHLFR